MRGGDSLQNIEIEHKLEVYHPGKGEDNIESVSLIEVKNRQGKPLSFYMDVESVICYENLCKIVPVRLFWNVIGEYQRYEIAKGVQLEKYEGKPYTMEDYQKTHQILLNKSSPFKTTLIEEILTTVKSHDIVDVVAGETLLEMNEEDTVHGASLTCFTLWHWANGNIVPIIRDITSTSMDDEAYQNYLAGKNIANQLFAIEQLTRTANYKTTVVNKIANAVLLNDELTLSVIIYIENAPADIYFSMAKTLIKNGTQKTKVATLNSILNNNNNNNNNNNKASKVYFEDLSSQLKQLQSLQEVSLFLRILDKEKIESKQIVDNLIPLLKKDFMIARLAYWFLNNTELTKKQSLIVNAFFQSHKNQL